MRRESARGAERPLPGSVRQCEMAHALPPWAAEEELARARAWRGCLGTRKGRRGSWKAKAAPSGAWTRQVHPQAVQIHPRASSGAVACLEILGKSRRPQRGD